MQAQEEQSLFDYIINLAPADTYLVIPSILGALLLFGLWYWKKFDTELHARVDDKKKQFRLGGFYTVLIGFVGGAGLGFLARDRVGMDLESTAVIAFLGGILAPWLVVKVGHKNWSLVSRVASHPLLAPAKYAPPSRALPYAGRELSVLDRKIMSATGSTTAPIDDKGLRDWEQRRELIMQRMLGWWNRQREFPKEYQCIPTEELEAVHSIFPAVGDVRSLLTRVKSLQSQETNLSLSQKLGYEQTLLAHRQVIEEQKELIGDYKEELERGKRAQDPQYQLTKQVIYGFFGFIFRQVLVWLGV